MYNSPYWLDFSKLWTDWPNREMKGLFKWYYLVQFAFWLQQIFVLNVEAPRKDHYQMLTHHIITCTMIFIGYGYHFTGTSNVLLCIMDVVDILLPVGHPISSFDSDTIAQALSASQDPEVSALRDRMRHCIWRLYHYMVRCATRSLQHLLVVNLQRCPESRKLWVLLLENRRDDWSGG